MREKIWTWHFIVICLSSFFMFLNLYVTATTFPLYLKNILGGTQQQMGLAITFFVIGGVAMRPFSGQWVDRFGKKKMAVLGSVLFTLFSISYYAQGGIVFFLLLRVLQGMSYSIASTAASAIASELVPDSRKGEGIGYFSMFMSIAMVIGPALGIALWGEGNAGVLLLVCCVISACSLLFAAGSRVPKDEPQPRREPQQERKGGQLLSRFFETKALPISLTGFVLAFSYSSITGFIASFTAEIHQSAVTSYFFIVFALMIVLSRPVIGRIFDKYNEHMLAYPGILLFIGSMFLLSQAHSAAMILTAGVIMGTGYGALLPCFQTLAMKLSPEHRRGLATGTFFLLFDSGYGVGSYLFGWLSSIAGYRLMYEAAGVIALLCLAVYYMLHHRPRSARTVGLVRNDSVSG